MGVYKMMILLLCVGLSFATYVKSIRLIHIKHTVQSGMESCVENVTRFINTVNKMLVVNKNMHEIKVSSFLEYPVITLLLR